MTESNEDKKPRDPEDTSGDVGIPEDETSHTGSAAKPGDTEDASAPAGPAEEKDRKTQDDRGLTTDTSPSD
ncbi:hypothetical protein E4J89_15350 [Arthrobacter sp. CAU 1506]|uniref:hypothetical protein n=1 Tax=Arthrobacter sp. CAU 1506 TaxID=2560052 RepID=UPI0010ACDA45|nr:hypothetical protein [Arthrobacter sp. CAU 1506]TJY67267.1 hypothetical protein E4J89_15350 [Arthrobacter sp. CAU 1506]